MSDKKSKEQELQEWLDAVHYGSCCSDPIEPNDCQVNTKKEVANPTNKKLSTS